MFVDDLAVAYIKWAKINNLNPEVMINENGYVSINVPNGWKLFAQESGKHCVQRVPPTEKNGRRQTSMVGVMITRLSDGDNYALSDKDVSFNYFIGTGPGGQHKQKTASACRAKHIPTGMSVVIDGRNQHQNKRLALRLLAAKVKKYYENISHEKENAKKSAQWGKGCRSDKVRTYNFIDSRAVDHRTGKKTKNVKDVIYKGKFDLLL